MPAAGRVLVIGAGRAGRALAVALAAAGVDIIGLHGRERSLPAALARAEVILVAVPDAAVGSVFDELAAAEPGGPAPDAVVLQLSGARAADAADTRLRARVRGVGTFHPLVALAEPEAGAARLRGAWIGVAGDEAAIAVGTAIAAALGAHTLRVPDDPDARAIYHAAAVFASNFPVVVAAVAERLFEDAGVNAAGARGAVRQLLQSAATNVAATDPAAALTGPVARGDAATVARHLAALASDPAAAALYRALARATVGLARTNERPGHRVAGSLDEIDALLS